jgi:ferredoxin
MISEEIGLNDFLEANGHRAGRDRSRRIHHPAARHETPSPHHRAGDPSHEGAGRRFPRATRDLPPDRDLSRARAAARRGAQILREKVPRRRRRHHRREFPHRRDRHVDHRHQRGQRRSHPDPAQGAYRHRLDRKARADARGRGADPARAGALGDRPGHVGLHHALDRAAPAGRSRRAGEYHVVLLDNGRSAMLGGEFEDMLRCIRCGACMNHCPVYQAVGGHAYGWVYPGPMGAVLTPSLIGVAEAGICPTPRPSAAAAKRSARCAFRCPR